MIASALALLVMQVGPNPAMGAIPGVPEELRDRPKRDSSAEQAALAAPRDKRLAQCLSLASGDAEAARDFAQSWRETAGDELDLAQSAHCLGLALVRLEDFSGAQQAFEIAASEAPDGLPAYRARLSAMAGNAALAQEKPALAELAFARAIDFAESAADGPLRAGLAIDRARALVALDRSDEAAEALASARTADPDNARAWLLSATLSRRLERLGEAQTQIERAAALAPLDPAVGLEAGVIAALGGREDDARKSFESVLRVDPDSEEAGKAAAYLEQLQP